jgi:predicted Zn-dependent protease
LFILSNKSLFSLSAKKSAVNTFTRVRPSLFLATVFYVLALLVCPQPVSAKDNWLMVRSKNFLLVGNASEKEIRQVGARLEQFREVFSRLFTAANVKSPVPTTVVVFKSDSSYRPFKPISNVAGYFQPGPDVNYITLTTEYRGVEQNTFSIIFHEYTHLLVNATSGNVPTWFNEGLAEYYSTFSITDDQKVVLGKPISNHVFLLREKKMLPLRSLFQVDHKSPEYNERAKQSIFYAESWALMHYLIQSKEGQRLKEMGKFLDLMNANVPMEEAFQKSFSMTFAEMEKELRNYIQHDRYPVTSGQFENKVKFDSEMQAAPITEAEAQAYLGDLLLHGNRPEAEAYLQKALELDPNLAMAHASLGMLRVRQHKPDEARKSLERAVAGNSQNYLTHYYYACALSREGMAEGELVASYPAETAAKMRAELKKAIELRPDYPESYSLLAFVNLVAGNQLDESVELLRRAIAIAPGRNDLAFMLAQVLMRKEDFKSARQLLEKLSKNNSDDQVRQRAENLLAQITTFEEQAAKYRAFKEEQAKNSGNRSSEPGSIVVLGESEVTATADPSSYLREALRKPLVGETQVQGLLMRIDCDAKGIVFVVRVGSRQLRLKTKSFEDMDITSFVTSAAGEITCGVRKPESDVVVDYLPAAEARAKIDGIMKSLEFVPSDFKLKAGP